MSIDHLDDGGHRRVVDARVADLFARDGAEYMRLDDGSLIRLDRIVSIEDAQPELGVRGALRARLLSGELPSSVDDDVTSYEMIASPLPGLLYTVAAGTKRGLWFAAL